ncbi:MAG: sulfatase [Planctomycetes bacterium]|nr:sulfatase [Planctomycetota bacterium]
MNRTVSLLLLLALSACGEPAGVARGPDVVIIVMDTTRGDRCSVNGYGKPTTPALTALAREGTLFRNAWGPADWTGPGHASLFTGLRPENHGFLRAVRDYLDESAVTLAERLKAAGYRTACFSNNPTFAEEFGLCQGFESIFPLYEDEDRPYPWSRATHDMALEWIVDSRRGGRPFFLFVNDMEPHVPYTPPQETTPAFLPPGVPATTVAAARELTAGNLFGHNCRARPLGAGTLAAISGLYDGEIACLDAEIGRFVEALRGRGLLDRTLFVVTADHGENLGDHGLTDHMFSLHRSVRHLPMVVRYPPAIPAGKVVDDLVRLEDVAPTVLEIAGLEPLVAIDGLTLRGDVTGRLSYGAADAPHGLLDRLAKEFPLPFSDTELRHDIRAVADGRHHYIRYSSGREELYDLVNDPAEKWNLASKSGPELDRMRALLEQGRLPRPR